MHVASSAHASAAAGRAAAPDGSRDGRHVVVDEVCKHFGGAQALDRVSVSIGRGEVHALVGENGAGKSTLGRTIAGLISPDAGSIVVDGERLRSLTPRQALRRGITMIAQELVLLPSHNVLDNVFLGVEDTRFGLIDRAAQLRRFEELDERTGFGLRPDAIVGHLKIADQQLVEIMRALARDARLIVMDEPTAALTRDEAGKLLALVRGLREHGTTIVYVSHQLDDVLAVADTVTVLKDGRVVATGSAAEQTPDTLVSSMLGMDLDLAFPAKVAPRAGVVPALSVSDVSFAGASAPASFEVRAGEIVGIAGLVGSGRSELARAIFGADSGTTGEVSVAGKRLARRSPRASIRAGLVMLPEDRRGLGLLMGRSVMENITIANLASVCAGSVVRRGSECAAADRLIHQLNVKPPARTMPVALLSGGNQQKVMIAKAHFCGPRVLIVDEPTRGVDVGAKRAIYRLIVEMAEQGLGVLVISSEFEEVIGLAHRILVMQVGRIVRELPGDTDEETLMRAAVIGQ